MIYQIREHTAPSLGAALLKSSKGKTIESIIKDSMETRVVIIGENHTYKSHTARERGMIHNILAANTGREYALCLEPETPISDFPDLPRYTLWNDGANGIQFSMDMAYFHESNMASAEMISARVAEKKSVIAICGNAHLRHDFGIPALLRNTRITPVVIYQDETLPTGLLSERTYNISSA